ncbi:MAG: hypothetical protein HOW73_20850 [Polyangiaceae bacterium]|nr:hypothetical protein [Polyangiaceae bacterium]
MANRFDPGRIVATPGALALVCRDALRAYVTRHVQGDWGALAQEDRTTQDTALARGVGPKDEARFMSVWHWGQAALWIMTDGSVPDRITTILLAEEH